jgi:integrase
MSPRYQPPPIATVAPPQSDEHEAPDRQAAERQAIEEGARIRATSTSLDPYRIQQRPDERTPAPGARVPSFWFDLLLEAESEARARRSLERWPPTGDQGDPRNPMLDDELPAARERLATVRKYEHHESPWHPPSRNRTRSVALPTRGGGGLARGARNDGHGRPRSANDPSGPRPPERSLFDARIHLANDPAGAPGANRGGHLMPAIQCGHARRLPSGKWQLRYYDAEGARRTGGAFPSKSAALKHYRDVIEPRLRGATPELTLRQLADVYLTRHGQIRSAATIRTLRHRLARPLKAYGEVTLRELEGMSGELADFRASLPERFAHDVMRALRQTFAAGVRYGHMTSNPAVAAGDNPAPKPRAVRAYTLAELDALEAEIGPEYGPLVPLVAATGTRPLEAALLARRDADRKGRILTVRGTKTSGSWREVPLSGRALAALDRLPARLDTPLLFPAPEGGPLNLNFRRRVWTPAVEAAGVAKPARIYDLRSTFASNALAAGVTVFELAKVMGTSVAMIERHYGALIGGAHAGIAGRLDAIETRLQQAAEAEAGEA